MPTRSVTRSLTVATAALLLAACGADDDAQDAAPPAEEPSAEAPGEAEGDAPPAEDPNDLVSDGAFRGDGLVVPALDGWTFDEMAFQQGMIVAVSDDDTERFIGLPIPTSGLAEGQELDYGLLLDDLQGLPQDATVDEDVSIEGATQARQLRFDELPAQGEGQQPSTELLVAADDGDGLLAIFNYNADVDAFDEDHAQTFLDGIGFDPDSAPTPPEPAPAVTP